MFPPKARIPVFDDMGPLRAIVKGQLKENDWGQCPSSRLPLRVSAPW